MDKGVLISVFGVLLGILVVAVLIVGLISVVREEAALSPTAGKVSKGGMFASKKFSGGTGESLPTPNKLCGNSLQNIGEDCNNCPQDFPCAFGDTCQSGWGGSVELISVTDNSATIKVTNAQGESETREIQEGDTQTIMGLNIQLSPFNNYSLASFSVSKIDGSGWWAIEFQKIGVKDFPVSQGYKCDLNCEMERVVNNGDPYFKENLSDVKWRWIVKNLDQQIATQVGSQSNNFDIYGPAIGVGHTFYTYSRETALEQPLPDTHWENRPNWASPYEYLSLNFVQYSPQETGESGDRGAAIVRSKTGLYDNVTVIGIPVEYAPYISSNYFATLSLLAPQLDPVEAVPAIIPYMEEANKTSYQIKFVGKRGWVGQFYYRSIGLEGYEYINGYLEKVFDDGTVRISLTNSSCPDSNWINCINSEMGYQDIAIDQEIRIYDHFVRNYYAKSYESNENLGWSLLYLRGLDQDTTSVKPTNELFFQVINKTGGDDQGLKVLISYRDFKTGQINYLTSYPLLEFNEGWQAEFARIDYYNAVDYFSFGLRNGNFELIKDSENAYNDEAIGECDSLKQKYKLVNGMLFSYGQVDNFAEEGELVCYRGSSQEEDIPLGLVDHDFYFDSITEVISPRTSSGSENENRYKLFNGPRMPYAGFEVYRGGYYSGGEVVNYWNKNLGDPIWFYSNLTFGRGQVNPLGLERKISTFNNQETVIEEAVVYGKEYPKFVFYPNFDGQPSDFDPRRIYIATDKSIDEQGNLGDGGFIYLNIFDEPTNLQSLSQQNKLQLIFLGKKHELVGYVDSDSVLIKPYCDPICDNGLIEDGEECDGNNLNGQSCESLGLGSGELRCQNFGLSDQCQFNTKDCTCGNGMIDVGEECDRWELNGQSCQSQGYSGGELGCKEDCSFDTSQCAYCGNGILEDGEECDRGNENGYYAECTDSCQWGRCGDGVCGYDHFKAPNGGPEGCPPVGHCFIDCNPCTCLAGGTNILTAMGEKYIEELKVGDSVMSYNEKTGRKEVSRILETFVHDAEEYLVINGRLKITSEHPVFVNGEWKKAGEIEAGDRLKSVDGEIIVLTKKIVRENLKVYNLEVGGNHNYFAEGVLVHNKPPQDPCLLDPDGCEPSPYVDPDKPK